VAIKRYHCIWQHLPLQLADANQLPVDDEAVPSFVSFINQMQGTDYGLDCAVFYVPANTV